jgi:hypothetical protein
MALNSMAGLWARTALIWFLLTMGVGMYLGMTQQFQYSSPHAHMGLLGWVSSALFAFLHALTGGPPAAARGPVVHWVAHNLGVATMATGLFLTIRHGPSALTALIPLGGATVLLATIWLALMLWPKLRAR